MKAPKLTTEQCIDEAKRLLAKWRAEAKAKYDLQLPYDKTDHIDIHNVAVQAYVDGCLATYRDLKGML